MTRKDYVLLAAALKESRHEYAGDTLVHDSKMNQWEATVTFVASALERENPRFNRETFLTAAGVYEI